MFQFRISGDCYINLLGRQDRLPVFIATNNKSCRKITVHDKYVIDSLFITLIINITTQTENIWDFVVCFPPFINQLILLVCKTMATELTLDELPDEILLLIFAHLTPKCVLLVVSLVCKKFYALTSNDNYWRRRLASVGLTYSNSCSKK